MVGLNPKDPNIIYDSMLIDVISGHFREKSDRAE